MKLNPRLLLDAVYPIGSIYMSVNSTSPEALFGGKWEQLKDRFLLGAGDTYSNGSTGGEATHTLSVEEMPTHHHALRWYGLGSGNGAKLAYGNSNASFIGNDGAPMLDVGGSKAHNNMPPYLAVYIWKRVS